MERLEATREKANQDCLCRIFNSAKGNFYFVAPGAGRFDVLWFSIMTQEAAG
jgi:hypothetical protein